MNKDSKLENILDEIPEEDQEDVRNDIENFIYEMNLRLQIVENQFDDAPKKVFVHEAFLDKHRAPKA